MFYKLIKKKCDEWMKSPDCTIRELIQYIYTQNKMRDAQIDVNTPIAQGLLGKKVGDVAEITIPQGKISLEVVNISF